MNSSQLPVTTTEESHTSGLGGHGAHVHLPHTDIHTHVIKSNDKHFFFKLEMLAEEGVSASTSGLHTGLYMQCTPWQ